MSYNPGLHCKACDTPLTLIDDPELCGDCMAVVYYYNKKLLDEVDAAEVFDLELLMQEEE